MPSQIAVIGRLNSVTVLQIIVARLREAGHEVSFFPDSKAFHEANATLAAVDVAVIAPSFTCSRDIMAPARRLRGIVSPITGIDGFDMAAATELGILVTNGQVPENTDSMAEATILLMLAALYDLHGTEAVLRDNRPRPMHMSSRMLQGKHIGLIGFGQIARAIAARLAGWGATLQAYARRPPTDVQTEVQFIDLDTLLQTSDVICVLAALNNESRGLLDAQRLRLLKQDAVLINTGRGPIIDEVALCRIAAERPDLCIALDTFAEEPLPLTSPLRDIPNAILTPHMIGHTRESQDALPDRAVENVTRILAGQLPQTVCNPDVIKRWQGRWNASAQE